MKRSYTRAFEAGILLLAIVVYCRPAHAYVDMGTGSYILQISIAAAAGALFSLKLFWAGLLNRLRAAMAQAVVTRSETGTPVSSGTDAG